MKFQATIAFEFETDNFLGVKPELKDAEILADEIWRGRVDPPEDYTIKVKEIKTRKKPMFKKKGGRK